MKIEKNICMKFPAVLRQKLLDNEIEFPDSIQFEYEPLYTYRAVQRSEDDYREVSMEDFKSYFDLGKKARGIKENFAKDPQYYGVSSFLKKEIVELKMKFPNPRKKLASGYVYSKGGPQYTVEDHVCWWLYEGCDVSGFKLLVEENKNNE